MLFIFTSQIDGISVFIILWTFFYKFFYLTFFIVPSSVRNFTCIETLETEILLSWLEPEPKNGIIKRYQISGNGHTEDLDGNHTEKMFEGLRKY